MAFRVVMLVVGSYHFPASCDDPPPGMMRKVGMMDPCRLRFIGKWTWMWPGLGDFGNAKKSGAPPEISGEFLILQDTQIRSNDNNYINWIS